MKNEKNISSNTGQTGKAVANLPSQHPFKVPNGYFEQFPEKILQLVHVDPLFQFKSTNANPFNAPERYFDTFSDTLLQKIRSEENAITEIESLAPGLLSLKEQNPFSVPEGYFNKFETTISSSKRKFVPIFGIKNIIRYAAAACVIGFMFFVYRGNNNNSTKIEQSLASNAKTSELSTEAISSFLGESDAQIDIPENEELVSKDINLLVNIDKETVSQVLTEVSENDIEQFLKQSVNTENNNIN